MKFRGADYYYLKMATHYIEVPYYQHKRRVRILLPKDYEAGTDKRYPVLYMHDGQNVFYSKEAYSGYSWKVIPTIKQHPDLEQMIVVGIDNAGEQRLDEYGPWPVDQTQLTEKFEAGGDGRMYGQWLVETLKPWVDQHYRTRPEAATTLMAGSSMGGIITAYIGAAYPEVFGHLGIYSLASWFSEPAFLSYIARHSLNSDTHVYLQVGTNEGNSGDEAFLEESQMNQAYIDATLNYYQTLLRAGHPVDQILLRITSGGTHQEKVWADHFKEFLEFSQVKLKTKYD